MSLLAQVQEDMKTAMKAKDKQTLGVVRQIKSAVMNEQINVGHDLTEEEELSVLSREVKQRKESIAEFKEGGRDDLAEATQAELDVLAKYLPAQMTEEEIKQVVAAAIEKTGANSPKDMGKVMGIVSAQTKGRADGKVVADTVKQALAN
ncbi:GatB/YqeY domain-containing protein [Fructobacillus parabroussonetiae]|uniref:GatB/YqeY domain-containing protein n=1 Tax=Fructobacillus parabroussonetiae TaxID=2713174 RepID=A0ABS5QVK4_9LACO|nr:GatB/YqeY domain-containing protein [Fructobacillus parabroussonetiae]MBS9337236.1 GatB/YqeY domain-containing protein [Fructobacillus parabroussonetiae]MCK8617102.1 GatB/YqeY domain-containing protein [Fructobacillus parabroussonetiae]